MVHELGHNIGMYHDFDDYQQWHHDGQGCNGHGFMSYNNHYNGWSECSKQDLLIYYNTMIDNWCMPEDPNACAPSTVSCPFSQHWPMTYSNGYCSHDSNNPECGYDGGDCCIQRGNWTDWCKGDTVEEKISCSCMGMNCPEYEKEPHRIRDGKCDGDLNYPGCFYDGGDCCSQEYGWDKDCHDSEKCKCLDPHFPRTRFP